MDLSLSSVVALLRETLSDPKASARRIMALPLPMSARWQALLLVVVLSVLFGQLSVLLMTEAGMPNPLQAGVVQGMALLIMVFAAHGVGRLMGGRGQFDQALILVVWLQAVMVAIQLVQVVALLVVPALSALIGVLGMALFLWLLTNYVAVLHGFESLGKVFAVILLTLFGIAMVLAMLLQMLGIAPPGMVVDV